MDPTTTNPPPPPFPMYVTVADKHPHKPYHEQDEQDNASGEEYHSDYFARMASSVPWQSPHVNTTTDNDDDDVEMSGDKVHDMASFHYATHKDDNDDDDDLHEQDKDSDNGNQESDKDMERPLAPTEDGVGTVLPHPPNPWMMDYKQMTEEKLQQTIQEYETHARTMYDAIATFVQDTKPIYEEWQVLLQTEADESKRIDRVDLQFNPSVRREMDN